MEVREEEVRTAEDYFFRIDEFNKSILYWCIATQLLILVIQNLEKMNEATDKISIKIASEIVGKKFSEIIEKATRTGDAKDGAIS
jgi:hypothetical protein